MTGNAPSNDLLDPDIHGLVERRLERHIDPDGGFVPRAVYLFANGAEGDVSPAWPPQSRCNVPTLAPMPALNSRSRAPCGSGAILPPRTWAPAGTPREKRSA